MTITHQTTSTIMTPHKPVKIMTKIKMRTSIIALMEMIMIAVTAITAPHKQRCHV